MAMWSREATDGAAGATPEEGVAIGALSLVNRDCMAVGIYPGKPVRRISERMRGLLEMEQRLSASKAQKA